MSFSTTTTTTNTADEGVQAAAVITNIHQDIIQIHILPKLDGPTLASTSCTSSKLNTLCYEEKLWKDICNSSWPSTADPLIRDIISTFSVGYRSFFSDASSTTVNHQLPGSCSYQDRTSKISRLISAVDIHFEDKLICSRVIVTDTKTCWFSCSAFKLDLFEPKEILSTPVTILDGDLDTCMARAENSMRLSWILIDPDTKRALNVSGINPVAVRRHWLNQEFQAGYAMVVPGGDGGGLVQCGVVVTYRKKDGGRIELQVKEVSMVMEDIEGMILTGKDGLVILQDAMEEERRLRKSVEEKDKYEMFVKMNTEWNEKHQIKEKRLDMVFVIIGIMMLIASSIIFVLLP